jgi:hypothetical protein
LPGGRELLSPARGTSYKRWPVQSCNTLLHAVWDERLGGVHRLAASSRCPGSSSGLLAFSSWPVPSQSLAHQIVPPIAFGTVHN